MATQAQTIIDAAIKSSIANDGGASPIGNDRTELLGVLSRKVRQIYALAALPPERGGSSSGDIFKTTWSFTVGTPNTTLAALPGSPEIAVLDSIQTATGTVVALVAYRDFLEGRADFAPAIVRIGNKLRSCARTDDPAAGAILTLFGSYIPAEITADTHYVGATTATDAATTAWPSAAGDPYLIAAMGLYLAMKDATRGDAEIQNYVADLTAAAQILATTLGINAAALVTSEDKPANGS